MIAIDIETYDPNLAELGDGAVRKDGRILCVGAYGDGISEVFDFDYPEHVEKCKELIERDEPKIFHNGVYDLSWLCCAYDFKPKGTLHDTMTRASFINEYQELNLDACCKAMGLKGKNKNETIEAWYSEWQSIMKDAAKGLKKGYLTDDNEIYCPEADITMRFNDREIGLLISGDYRKNVWANILEVWADREGRSLLKKYNLQDCVATYNLFMKQEPLMRGSEDAYKVECDLYYLLIDMKKRGVKIDVNKLQELTEKVDNDKDAAEMRLKEMYGIDEEIISSPKKLRIRMNELGIHSPIHTKTGESFAADALARIHHPAVDAILEFKNYEAISNKYLHGALRKALVGDRIHCTFSPSKRELGGTVTGRFASSTPNLQNIPAKNKGHGTDYSQDMRALFIPEEGCMMGAFDYSQIEYLLLAHFAKGPQAEWFRKQANDGVDFHTVAMGMTHIPNRTVVKTFNYGVIYGMGWKTAMDRNYVLFEKLAKEAGVSIESYVKDVYNNYHAKMPVIRDTMEWCQNLAKQQGYVECLGGRKQHKPKPMYDPATGKINDFIYKMLNKLIQTSAAYILKYSLRDSWKAGVFDVCPMHITVHDENVASIPFNKEGTEAAAEMKYIMDTSFHNELLVPMKACGEVGPNWGYWSDDIWNEMLKGNFNPDFFNKDYKETH